MLIITEDKSAKDNNKVLKLISNHLIRIDYLMSRLNTNLMFLHFHEDYMKIEEGTWEQRRQVGLNINELNNRIKDLDKVILLFEKQDTTVAIAEKQSSLNTATISLNGIRTNMLSIWEVRDVGDTPEDNKKIHDLLKKVSNTVQGLLQKINVYVKDFNKNSHVKLTFSVKWVTLPK